MNLYHSNVSVLTAGKSFLFFSLQSVQDQRTENGSDQQTGYAGEESRTYVMTMLWFAFVLFFSCSDLELSLGYTTQILTSKQVLKHQESFTCRYCK